MSSFLKERLPNYDPYVQYAMVVAVIVLISFLFPNHAKFKYEFQVGDHWRYDDLIAPFDVPIKKTDAEGKEDRERALLDSPLFYRKDTILAAAKMKEARLAIENWAKADTVFGEAEKENFKFAAAKALSNIYEDHIVQLADEHLESSDPLFLTVVEGNTTYRLEKQRQLTPRAAVTSLDNTLKDSGLAWPAPLQDILRTAISPNLFFDPELTEKVRENALAGLVTTSGIVPAGRPIVRRGELVTKEIYQKLHSLREAFQSEIGSKRSGRAVYLGYLLITSLILASLMLYLYAHRQDVLLNWRYLAFLLLWILMFSGLSFLVERQAGMNAYMLPYCIVPIVVTHFFGFRLAFFTNVMVALLAGFITQLGMPFLFIQIIAGVVAVLAVADARDWSKFFKSVLAIVMAYCLSYLGIYAIEEGNWSSVNWENIGIYGLNGLLTLLAFPLIPLAERLFGFTSSISLVELSDMSRPLLKELSIKAPGTMQHSLQVSNLSEAAANAIGADALLVRVAALYHDVGKMNRPTYFVENQGNVNPHSVLNPVDSAKIIIGHVAEGLEMAKKAGVPKVVCRFIATHHGTTRADFFYKKYLQDNPGLTVDEAPFTYPGPKPATKEEAILMLADTIEAASRSLKSPTHEDIEVMVDKLVSQKVKAGQLYESNLTLGELAECKAVFKKMLHSIHHVRIEYPK